MGGNHHEAEQKKDRREVYRSERIGGKNCSGDDHGERAEKGDSRPVEYEAGEASDCDKKIGYRKDQQVFHN